MPQAITEAYRLFHTALAELYTSGEPTRFAVPLEVLAVGLRSLDTGQRPAGQGNQENRKMFSGQQGEAVKMTEKLSELTLRAGALVWSEHGFRPELLRHTEVRLLAQTTFKCLSKAVLSGLKGGKATAHAQQGDTLTLDRPSISYEIDPVLQSALEHNAFIFSGFKTYHLLRELGLSLTQPDGSIKPYEAFQQSVLALDKLYNRAYLRAEYNYAVASSQMAERWQRFQQNADRYDLQYRTAGDERVREEHARLDGITLPPSDPFWNLYYPPNGWGCRCTAVQVRRDKFPRSNPQEAMRAGDACTDRPKQRIFRFNAGKSMKLFPPKHPYMPKGCQNCQWRATLTFPDHNLFNLAYNPQREACRTCQIIRESYNLQSKSNNADARRDLVKWVKDNLPVVKVGKFKAQRWTVQTNDVDEPTYINRVFYNEISFHHKDDSLYRFRLQIAKKAHLILPLATRIGQEIPKDHPEAKSFDIYQYDEKRYTVIMKVKVNADGRYLHYLEVHQKK